MKTYALPFAAALMLALSPFPATAQASAPLPNAAASASPAAKAGPRLLTPAESRDSASPPGDLRPERPVAPQINIPLGKTPRPSVKSESRAVRPGKAASAGGIDDAAARCEAQADEQVRAKCRDDRARDARSRRPG
jgi:hypothetical protein